jgi:hypothetical protein
MALFGNFDDSYTKTGKGFFTKLANGLSFIPFIGGGLKFGLGMVDTVIESAQWLFRGKIGSAATALAAGTVGSLVNGATGLFWWNIGSGAATSTSLATHARAMTESVIGGVSGALGEKPQVLRAYPAGIGSISEGVTPQGPGKFAQKVSGERGQDANAAHARYMSGEGGVHINELQSAHGRGA